MTMRLSVTLVVLAAVLAGCNNEKVVERKAPAPPPPTYQGPEFLRTTIGSLTTLQGYQPILVGGFGFVVNLDDTGSADCPPMLREWMLREIRKGGFGRSALGTNNLSPESVLASDRTAVVAVQGVIPPGAPKGTRFDLLVSALPQTQTTSLQGGQLYRLELRPGGTDLNRPQGSVLATGGPGSIFINPFAETAREGQPTLESDTRTGRILAGGVTTENMPILLRLNQASWQRSRLVADRINGRFPKEPRDKSAVAVARDDSHIELHIPSSYSDRPQEMIGLIQHLFLNPTMDFQLAKARELVQLLVQPENHQYAEDVALIWESMGRGIVPILQELYDHQDPVVRITALQAGAHLKDPLAAEPLNQIARSGGIGYNEHATKLLGNLLKRLPEHYRAATMLRELLDADDAFVRLAAFEALNEVNDPYVRRFQTSDKMELCLVRAQKPMIYVTRHSRPRIVIFNSMLGFKPSSFFSTWDNNLMLRVADSEQPADVYYNAPQWTRGQTTQIAPTVANLVVLMASRPDKDSDRMGLDLSYSQIVQILYQLTQEKLVEAPFVLQPTDLAQRIADYEQLNEQSGRPESSSASEAAPAAVESAG